MDSFNAIQKEFSEIQKALNDNFKIIRSVLDCTDVIIFGQNFEIWTSGNHLFIRDFPILNNLENEVDGFSGNVEEIIQLLKDITTKRKWIIKIFEG